jgi:hypothetical protein
MNNKLSKESLVIAITLLFIINYTTPIIIGYNVSTEDESQVSILEEPLGVEWSKVYGEGNLAVDWGNSVRQTKDGGYILLGTTKSYSPDGFEAGCLIKTDVIGNIEWIKTYGEEGPYNIDVAYSVDQTDDGGYIFTGNTQSYGLESTQLWLVKTDSKGKEEWNNIYGGKELDHGYSVKQTDDGGYVAAGYTNSYGAGYLDFLLVKTDSNGTEEWIRTFGGVEGDKCWSMDTTDDGGYILTGVTLSYGAGEYNLWLVKTDSNGIEEWNRTYRSMGEDASGDSVQQTKDGGYIITGNKYIEGYGRPVLLMKTDSNGNETWNKTFGESSGSYYGQEVQQTKDGGYIIVGYVKPIGPDYSFLIKTNANGSKKWELKFEEEYDSILNSVYQTYDGGYIVGGWSYTKDTHSPDFWLIKVGHVPDIEVTKPENAIYLFNRKIASFIRPLIIGPIKIEVNAYDDKYNIENVSFYVDDVFQASDTSRPYSWKWSKLSFFRHTLKAVAFNSNDNVGVEELVVSKFL